MPCRPAEDDPSITPCHGCRAARLLIWVCRQTGQAAPGWAHDVAEDWYSTDPRPTVELCRLMRALPDAKRAALTRASTSWMHWDLAHWWMKHEQADAAREDRRQQKAGRSGKSDADGQD